VADGAEDFAVDMNVRVYPGSDRETGGVIVEDFGGTTGEGVDVASTHFADPARRWAVRLDSGELVFVDSHQLGRA